MNAKLSQQMSLLALAALLFYGVLMAADLVSAEMLPQFVVSALIFFTSGRLLRKPAQISEEDEEQAEGKARKLRDEDWNWLSLLLNWGMSLLILAALALWVMMPVGVDLGAAFRSSSAHESFFSGYVP